MPASQLQQLQNIHTTDIAMPQTSSQYLPINMNIFETVDKNLHKNFTTIFNILNKHSQQIMQRSQQIYKLESQFNSFEHSLKNAITQEVQKQINNRNSNVRKLMNQQLQNSSIIQNLHNSSSAQLIKITEEIKKLQEKYITQQEQFKRIKNDTETIKAEQIGIKQKNQVKEHILSDLQITRRSLAEIRSNLLKVDENYKYLQYKIDKIQTLNGKFIEKQQSKQNIQMKQKGEKLKQPNFVKVTSILDIDQGFQEIKYQPKLPKRNISPKVSIFRDFDSDTLVELGVLKKGEQIKPGTNQNKGLEQSMKDRQKQSGKKIQPLDTSKLIISNRYEKLLTQLSNSVQNLEKRLERLESDLKKTNAKKPKNDSFIASFQSVTSLGDKINQITTQLLNLTLRSETFDEKVGKIQQKMEDKGRQITKLSEQLKEKSTAKIQQKITYLQNQFKSITKEINNKLDTKVDITDYQKFCKALNEKNQDLSDRIALKSEKVEVKKALLFLELKIKQIILVISDDEEQEKEALLTKKKIKCMSCDQEVDRAASLSHHAKQNWDMMSQRHEILGRFAMKNSGVLLKKTRNIENRQLPLLTSKKGDAIKEDGKSNNI